MKPKKVGILTAGGLAPCLSSAIGGLIERYTEIDPSIEIICYLGGYKGLLLGQSIKVDDKDCVKRGLVKEGEDPQKVAADQLVKDKVDILHTIGGDDTNTAAADLAKFLKENNYELTVIGLPKTIDNDEPRRVDCRRRGRKILPQRRIRKRRQPAHADNP